MAKLGSTIVIGIKHFFGWFLLTIGSIMLGILLQHGSELEWHHHIIATLIIAIFISLSADWLNHLRSKSYNESHIYRDGYNAGLNDALNMVEEKIDEK